VVIASLLALSGLAVESISVKRTVPKVIRLQGADGETVAEVRLLTAKFTVTGQGGIEYEEETGRVVAVGATLELSVRDGEPITIKAERIEILPDQDAERTEAKASAPIRYGFNDSFRRYFGEEGMEEVRRALAVQGALTGLDCELGEPNPRPGK
jgi:hypothetical protein